jgi:acyl dehydratase
MWTLSLRSRVAIELLALGLLTPTFLVVFPHRSFLLDLSLALLALGLLGLSAQFTTAVVWAQFPSPVAPPDRLRLCVRKVLALTLSGG